MIHVDNLVKKFGEVKAVDGVSFSVAAGEIFAFLGPNGAGKTTTIQMLPASPRCRAC
jgi:ABC-2 type transport system ATP-binding protein